MRYFTACCLAMLIMGATMATTASAKIPLPEIHLDEGTSATAAGERTGAEILKFETALGTPLTDNSVKLKLSVPSKLASLGTYIETILGVKQGASKECWTKNANKDEHVVIEGEYHLVDIDPGLRLGIDLLIPKTTILCGKPKELKVELKITIEGSAIGIVHVENMVLVTSFVILLKCTKAGTQEILGFLSEEEKEVKQKLTMNLGLGNEKACENIKEGVTIVPSVPGEFLF